MTTPELLDKLAAEAKATKALGMTTDGELFEAAVETIEQLKHENITLRRMLGKKS